MLNQLDCSIIIPAYNAGKVIVDLLPCFLRKTDCRFEVLIIDDGSTDDTAKVVSNFIAENKAENFRLITKPNGGVSSARNTGIKNAQGKYLCFIDADDLVNFPALEKMLSVALEADCPLVVANYITVNLLDGTEKKISHHLPCNQLLHRDYIAKEVMRRYFMGENDGLATVCNKLYRKSDLENSGILFDERRTHGEDWFFNIAFFRQIDSFYAVEESVYIYRLDGSQSYGKYYKNLNYALVSGYELIIGLNETYRFYDDKSMESKKPTVKFFYQILDVLSVREVDGKAKKKFLKNKTIKSALRRILKIKNQELENFGMSKREKLVAIALLFGKYRLALRMKK